MTDPRRLVRRLIASVGACVAFVTRPASVFPAQTIVPLEG